MLEQIHEFIRDLKKLGINTKEIEIEGIQLDKAEDQELLKMGVGQVGKLQEDLRKLMTRNMEKMLRKD